MKIKMKVKKNKNKTLNRSKFGNIFSFFLIALIGVFMALPMIYAINNSFKPLDELFIYPPKLFVRNPSMDNFTSLFNLLNETTIPFIRYLFNTLFITLLGTVGHVFIASLAAFALAKYKFPGRTFLMSIVVLSLMFVTQVTSIPNYMTMANLNWVDTPMSIIIPAFGAPLGLFLMKQFMENMVPDEIIETAKIDGANIPRTFMNIAMPLVKPAWLTLIIFSFQALWNNTGGVYIISEEWKPVSYAMSQIVSGGIARMGVGSAVGVVSMLVPIIMFVLAQSKVVETMSTSGIKG